MLRYAQFFIAALLFGTLASCGSSVDDDVTRIAFIGAETDLAEEGVRLAPAGQHLRAATSQGLVALNEQGEVVPALAERWIVTEDAMSYIFRLSNTSWPDGTRLSGGNVRAALQRNIEALEGTSLGLDLSIISEVRAMTGRVVEIRLKSPMPQFLQLLAQPELGLQRGGIGAGPMTAEVAKNSALLTVLPPADRAAPEANRWQDQQRQIRIFSLSAEKSAAAFDNGEVDAVYNGHLLSLPLAERGPLSQGTVRLDIVFGLFGLQINKADGVLADPSRREALAMAIDREGLLEAFGVGGWLPSTRIVPQSLTGAAGSQMERWEGQSIDQRKAAARSRIAAFAPSGASLTLAMPRRAGSSLFFSELAADFADIGITLERVAPSEKADLTLVDTLARYGDPRWFLNQFHCSLNNGLCSSAADALVAETLRVSDQTEQARLFTDAEAALLGANVYLPIGAPVRWSLIRGGVEGFSENPWGLHPLFPMALRPI